MAERPTTNELFKTGIVRGYRIREAIDNVIADGGSPAFPIAEGYALDLPAAVADHGDTIAILADPEAGTVFRRNMAMMAILLARPVKG